MLKTLGAQIKEFKAASIATPIFMTIEVLMETIIPFLMASIIDDGVDKGDMHHIYVVGGLMILIAVIGLLGGLGGARYGAKASAGFAKNLREAMFHINFMRIHPFEDGNGRTARLMSGYILDFYGYGFGGVGSLEEYFAYDSDEYYASLQMGLPVLYYSGRENPPHPEIWINYFLRMVELYSKKVYEISKGAQADDLEGSISYLNAKEKELLVFLLKKRLLEFTPIEVSKMIGVTNKTIINRCAKLTNNGFLIPNIVKQRIRSYSLSEFAKRNEKKIISTIG